MQRPIRLFLLLLLAVLLFLVACNREGVGGFSADSSLVAVVREDSKLYTTNINGGGTSLISESLGFGFDTTFSPDGSRVLYVDSGSSSVCRAPAGGGTPDCAGISLTGVTGGVLSYLPNGHIILAYRDSSNANRFRLIIFNESWGAIRDEADIDHFFLTTDTYKAKRGHNGTEWFLRPYDDDQTLRWVITRGEDAFAFTAAPGGVGGPNPLPARISAVVQNTLEERDIADITSGAVSPDGRTLAFRTGESGSLYSLYVMDLTRSDGSFVELVDGASFRIQYAFSPDGSQIAYESNAGGRSVWVANADGSNSRQLAANASLPDWQ
jgi:hypothetical protein